MFKRKMFVLFLAGFLVAGCGLRTVTGSGNLATREETITGFDKLDISQSFEVDISQGDTFSVVVRVDDNLVEYVQVIKKGNTLQIGLKPNSPNILNATLQAEVTMPELTGLDLSGSSHLQGNIEAGDVSFDLSGSSEVILTGSAQNVTIEASGSSEVDLADFSVVDANVDLSGSSEATVKPSGRLDVDASGSSRVYYLGSPTLGRMDTSGSSSIEQK